MFFEDPEKLQASKIHYFLDHLPDEKMNDQTQLAELKNLIRDTSTETLCNVIINNPKVRLCLSDEYFTIFWNDRWKDFHQDNMGQPQELISSLHLILGHYFYCLYTQKPENENVDYEFLLEKAIEYNNIHAITLKFIDLFQAGKTDEDVITPLISRATDSHKMPGHLLAARIYMTLGITLHDNSEKKVDYLQRAIDYINKAKELLPDSTAEIANVYGKLDWKEVEDFSSFKHAIKKIERLIKIEIKTQAKQDPTRFTP